LSILTEAWPTYLPPPIFEELSKKRPTMILVMGGYVPEVHSEYYFIDYMAYKPSYGSNPEKIGRQSLQLLFDATENKQSSIYSSIYTDIELDPNNAEREKIIIIGKGTGKVLTGLLDDLWKGCENKRDENCQYPIFFPMQKNKPNF